MGHRGLRGKYIRPLPVFSPVVMYTTIGSVSDYMTVSEVLIVTTSYKVLWLFVTLTVLLPQNFRLWPIEILQL